MSEELEYFDEIGELDDSEMNYEGNQYLRFEESIEKIVKRMSWAGYYVDDKKSISELDFWGIGEPNVLICVDVKDFENIYYSVKIIITDRETLKEKWYEIPETVEYMVMIDSGGVGSGYHIFRNNKNKFDYLEILRCYSNTVEKEELIKIINELIEDGIRNEVNIVDETILSYMLYADMYDEMIKMIERNEFGDKMFNKKKEKGMYFIHNISSRIILSDGDDGEMRNLRLLNIMLDKMSIEMLNYVDGCNSVFNLIIELNDVDIIMCVLSKITNIGILISTLKSNSYLYERGEIVEAIERKIEELER